MSELEELAEKYRVLARLRERREELEGRGERGFGDEEGKARRDEFRRIARRYPGALRELQASTAAGLRAKARAVEAEIAAGRTEPERAWIRVVLEFHAAVRDALVVKGWLARNVPREAAITPEVVAAFRAAHGGRADAALLEAHRHPPGGRLLALVWAALATRTGRPRAELERAVFGDPADP